MNFDPTTIGGHEREVGTGECLQYRVGCRVDELKPHNIPGTKTPCSIRDGTIINVVQGNYPEATIECKCGNKQIWSA